MRIGTYLVFNGRTREAVEFYKEVFNGEVEGMMTFGEGPQNPEYPLPEEAKNLIMHACLKVGEQNIMFSDAFPGQEVSENSNNITIVLNDITAEEAFALADKLKVNGKAIMEVQETFWSKAYGQIVDQFGINWQISADK